MPSSILLDIEGTTTPVDFVYRVLFPYARRHVKEFVSRFYGTEEVQVDIKQLRNDHASDQQQQQTHPAWRDESIDSQVESVTIYVHWLMDRDRKSTGLKSLQGKIWEVGYRSGQLQGQVYEDVPPALVRWSEQKKHISIYSSGSVLAQRLLFQYTKAGDLTRFLQGYFDTTTGPKRVMGALPRLLSNQHQKFFLSPTSSLNWTPPIRRDCKQRYAFDLGDPGHRPIPIQSSAVSMKFSLHDVNLLKKSYNNR